MPRRHRDKPFKDWDPEEESEDEEQDLWTEEDEEEYMYSDTTIQNQSNVTTKVSESRSREPAHF